MLRLMKPGGMMDKLDDIAGGDRVRGVDLGPAFSA